MPIDDSTDALHAAEGSVPDGILNDTDTVSTTVVGGIDETDGLSDGVTDDDELLERVRDDDNDGEDVTLSDEDALSLIDVLNDNVTESDADALQLKLVDTLAETDALTDGELE